MYFMPASSAILTHDSASNWVGLNWLASCSYSFTGILARFMFHSPIPAMGCPFHSPAGMAYRPQWMNRPNLAWRNHCILSSCDLGGFFLIGCANAAQTAKRATTDINDKCGGFIVTLYSLTNHVRMQVVLLHGLM